MPAIFSRIKEQRMYHLIVLWILLTILQRVRAAEEHLSKL